MQADDTRPIAIITGGAGYVGNAIAKKLLQNNWRVIALSRRGHALEAVETVECDITDEAQLASVIERIVATGRIHACIHAAASPIVRKPLLKITATEFDADISTAVYGAFYLAKAAIPHMVNGSVFIGITTASLEDRVPTASVGSYIPAKAALRGFLRTLSQEVRSGGIRINAIAPGFMADGLNRDLPESVRDFVSKKSDPKALTLGEIIETAFALCSDPTAYPSGTSITTPGKKLEQL